MRAVDPIGVALINLPQKIKKNRLIYQIYQKQQYQNAVTFQTFQRL
jgi:hypothetical protein